MRTLTKFVSILSCGCRQSPKAVTGIYILLRLPLGRTRLPICATRCFEHLTVGEDIGAWCYSNDFVWYKDQHDRDMRMGRPL